MALFFRKVASNNSFPLIEIKRFRGKINLRKPRPPCFEKAKIIALTKPWFLPQKDKTACTLLEIPKYKLQEEENPFQKILAQELYNWFNTSKLVAFCHYSPMAKEQEFKAFAMLKKENMHLKTYGKKTLEMAIKGTPYETVLEFYVSHNKLIFSKETKIKSLLKILRKFPQLILYAGIYEHKLLSREELVEISEIPSIQVAQANLVQVLNSVGSGIVSNLNSHQTVLVSHLENRVKQLEPGVEQQPNVSTENTDE